MKRKALSLLALLALPPLARAQADSVATVLLPGGERVEMVYVEGGTFTMGCNTAAKGVRQHYESSGPEHQVSVGSFFISRFEVTQQLWKAVMGDNPSLLVGDSLPVHQLSWDQAQQFTALLSQMTGRRFRLPSEAEWEFAARGGVRSQGYAFAGADRYRMDLYAWYCVNSGNALHRVGTMLPNELGIHDMSGNIAEWCADWVEPYTDAPQHNPRGPREGESRVVRGGHYESTSSACTVYDRGWYVPSVGTRFIGLRLVMEADPMQEGGAK